MKSTIAIAAVALLAGCAGGAGEPIVTLTSSEPPTQQQSQRCTCIGLACLIYGCMPAQETAPSGGTTASSFPLPPRPASFTSWTALEPERTTEAPGISMGLSWQRAPIESVWVLPLHAAPEDFRYDAAGGLLSIGVFSQGEAHGDLAPIGYAGMDTLRSEILAGFPPSDFTGLAATNVGAVANPYALGWSYQSFGAWTNQGIPGGNVYAVSFGAPTHASAIPVSGSATFNGKLAGLYLSPAGLGHTAAADLSVNVDFQARSLALASTGTVLTRDFASATPAPQLNVGGTLTYVAGINAFSGTLANAGGTMSGTSNGRFYGPLAQELGGVFALKSATTVEAFAGAYGARR